MRIGAAKYRDFALEVGKEASLMYTAITYISTLDIGNSLWMRTDSQFNKPPMKYMCLYYTLLRAFLAQILKNMIKERLTMNAFI